MVSMKEVCLSCFFETHGKIFWQWNINRSGFLLVGARIIDQTLLSSIVCDCCVTVQGNYAHDNQHQKLKLVEKLQLWKTMDLDDINCGTGFYVQQSKWNVIAASNNNGMFNFFLEFFQRLSETVENSTGFFFLLWKFFSQFIWRKIHFCETHKSFRSVNDESLNFFYFFQIGSESEHKWSHPSKLSNATILLKAIWLNCYMLTYLLHQTFVMMYYFTFAFE